MDDRVVDALTAAHRATFSLGNPVVDHRVVIDHIHPRELRARELVATASCYTVTEVDKLVIGALVRQSHGRFVEVGRFFGESAMAAVDAGAEVTSFDGNGCAHFTWPITVDSTACLVHEAAWRARGITGVTISNKLVNDTSHLVLDGRATLVDHPFTTPAQLPQAVDILFEDIISRVNGHAMALLAMLNACVASNRVRWAVVHDVHRFPQVATALRSLTTGHPTLHVTWPTTSVVNLAIIARQNDVPIADWPT